MHPRLQRTLSRAVMAAAALAPSLLHAQTPATPNRLAGWQELSPALQAMQRDDSQNPAWLWQADGMAAWAQPTGPQEKSCASCHGPSPQTSMAGVATRYPSWPTGSATPLNLAGRINQCRQQHQQAPAYAPESPELLGLTLLIGTASRGQPVAPAPGPQMDALRQQGAQLWGQRMGQLNLACTHCHDQLAGRQLAGARIPQGRATGYPAYRLEWQALGSLQRRLRACVTGVRAQAWPPGAPEWLALEAWMAQRDAGLAVETPGVRP